ncbi:MAG TPA: hypothetical protein VK427_06245 [Kofleriaceae bacterium]|nr:hypothetical protein [Kofleriaceae bacterium]
MRWWPAQPDSLKWDETLQIETDLAKSPTGFVTGVIRSIDEIEVDDHVTALGRTQIGPRYPQGEMVGSIWLSETYYNKIGGAKVLPRHQSPDAADYELTSILYWNNDKPDSRFFGFRGLVQSVRGTATELKVWHAGRGQIKHEQPLDVVVDAADLDPTMTLARNPGDDGAVFIRDARARELQLMGPKRPEAAGFTLLP